MATAENAVETPTKKKRKPGPGRPTNENAAPIKEAKQNRFFEAVNSVAAADWGTRITLYLYRLEPFTDRRKSGEFIYIHQYAEPVNEQRVMVDFGSGRYRLMLNTRKPGAERGDETDRYDFEICNQSHPPKIPKGEWVDDPRNIKWAWAKPFLVDPTAPAPQQQNGTGGQLIETLQVLNDIQDSTAARLKASMPPVVPVVPAAPISDPIDMAVKIIALTKGGGDTALIEMFREEMRALREQNSQLQTEARNRANQAPPDPLAQIDQLGNSVKKLREIGIIPEEKEEGVISKAIRSRMPAWMELLDHSLPELLKTLQPISAALAQKMMQVPRPAPPQNQPAIQAPAEQPQQAPAEQPTPEQAKAIEFMRFVQEVTPRIIKHVYDEAPGDVFAQWVADGYSIERVDEFRQLTPDQIVAFYRTTPVWPQLKDREAQFLKFWQEFHEWKPDELTDGMEDKESEAIG
jgi:hypothetical protein